MCGPCRRPCGRRWFDRAGGGGLRPSYIEGGWSAPARALARPRRTPSPPLRRMPATADGPASAGSPREGLEQLRRAEDENRTLRTRLDEAEEKLDRLRPLEMLSSKELIVAPVQHVRQEDSYPFATRWDGIAHVRSQLRV
eukprot:scaffold2874_cov384-Prasinococcus_capsulatus_cf.AAC.4